ncbi:minor capsid protein [Streptomyces levis]
MVQEIATDLEIAFPSGEYRLIRSSKMPAGQNGTLYELSLPDTPDNCVALYEYPGQAPMRLLGSAIPQENVSLQVMVRHKSATKALEWTKRITKHLITINGREVAGVYYMLVESKTSSPIDIGPDPNNRRRYTVNFSVAKNWSPDA